MATRILIVDDDPAIRMLIKAFVESENTFVVVGEAGTAAEALALAKDTEPDLVTMDYDMPGGNGADCIVEFKKRWPDVHVLALTSADRDATKKMIESGAYAKIEKAHMDLVIPALYEVADRREGERRAAPRDAITREQAESNDEYAELLKVIEDMEAEAERTLEAQKAGLAERLEAVVALRAVLVAAKNPRYSAEEARTMILSLATAILE